MRTRDTFRNRVTGCIRVSVFLSDNFGESKRSAQTSPQYDAHAKRIHNQLVMDMVKMSDKIITHHPITESVELDFKHFEKREVKKRNQMRITTAGS